MRNLPLLLLISITAFSCNNKPNYAQKQSLEVHSNVSTSDDTLTRETQDYQLVIDSNFLKTYTILQNSKINLTLEPQFDTPDRERIYSILKTQAQYFQLDSLNINNQIIGRLIAAKWPENTFDGDLKIIFLLTEDQSTNQIDLMRIGKLSTSSDVYIVEESVVQNGKIEFKREYTSIIDDEGNVGTKVTNRSYQINHLGFILLESEDSTN